MDRAKFLALAEQRGIDPRAYAIGRRADDAYVVITEMSGWSVFYDERGLKRDTMRFPSEAAALTELLWRLERDISARR